MFQRKPNTTQLKDEQLLQTKTLQNSWRNLRTCFFQLIWIVVKFIICMFLYVTVFSGGQHGLWETNKVSPAAKHFIFLSVVLKLYLNCFGKHLVVYVLKFLCWIFMTNTYLFVVNFEFKLYTFAVLRFSPRVTNLKQFISSNILDFFFTTPHFIDTNRNILFVLNVKSTQYKQAGYVSVSL